MTLEAFTQYFTDSEWLAQFLTNIVTLFVPVITIIASIISKLKSNTTQAIKKFKEETRQDFENLKAENEKLQENLEQLLKELEETKANTSKTMSMTAIAYTNSNLTASTKNEILKVMEADNASIETTKEANAKITENAELDKIEAPETLKEIAETVADEQPVEQNQVVL